MQSMADAQGIRCMIMRGGTSKGAYFLADDLPSDSEARDRLLLRIMGTPDPRQIDGIGGATPLTSKVAVVSPSPAGSATDVDYLFLQLGVGEPMVTDRQNCGNLLAGIGPFALERGLVAADGAGGEGAKRETSIRIRMVNTDSAATATFPVADGMPIYRGGTDISGVPGTAAPIRLDFEGIAGGSCGSLLPTGRPVDGIAGVACTLIDNGMPVIVMRADAVGVVGYESCAELEGDQNLRSKLESIRLASGPLMNLGDVSATSVPKLTLVAPPVDGGSLCTRTFIPHSCHEAIGVLGAVSVATAALMPDSPAASVLAIPCDDGSPSDPGSGPNDWVIRIEHPTGTFEAAIRASVGIDGLPVVERAGIIRTARKLMDGLVFPRDDR